MLKLVRSLTKLIICLSAPLLARDVLLEFKAAYFLFTDPCVKSIYGNGGALYGPEITFLLGKNWYGFASADFLSKKGHSVGLHNATKMDIVPLGVGLKYFVPFCYGDFYLGLGFQPVHLKTINCSPYVAEVTSKWGFGGIAKIGSYFDLPHNFFIDLFFDYSFVKVDCQKCAPGVIPLKANLSGCIFGAGLGYRFN